MIRAKTVCAGSGGWNYLSSRTTDMDHMRLPRGGRGVAEGWQGGESSSNLPWTVAHREHPQNSKKGIAGIHGPT